MQEVGIGNKPRCICVWCNNFAVVSDLVKQILAKQLLWFFKQNKQEKNQHASPRPPSNLFWCIHRYFFFYFMTLEEFTFTVKPELGASQHRGFWGKEQAVPYVTLASVQHWLQHELCFPAVKWLNNPFVNAEELWMNIGKELKELKQNGISTLSETLQYVVSYRKNNHSQEK